VLGYLKGRVGQEVHGEELDAIAGAGRRYRVATKSAGGPVIRVRGIDRVALHADLTMLARLSQALARARVVPLTALSGVGAFACRQAQGQKDSGEYQEHHAYSRRVAGEIDDGDHQECDPRQNVAQCLPRHNSTLLAGFVSPIETPNPQLR
jgi:hypothetical protein